MSFVQYRNTREFMGYEAGNVFRLLFRSSLPSTQLGAKISPGVVIFNQHTTQLVHVTHEEFKEVFQPAAWEWVPEQISLKEKTHGVRVGWRVKKKGVRDYHAEFWNHPAEVVGLHKDSGVYVKNHLGGVFHITENSLKTDFDIIPKVEDNK